MWKYFLLSDGIAYCSCVAHSTQQQNMIDVALCVNTAHSCMRHGCDGTNTWECTRKATLFSVWLKIALAYCSMLCKSTCYTFLNIFEICSNVECQDQFKPANCVLPTTLADILNSADSVTGSWPGCEHANFMLEQMYWDIRCLLRSSHQTADGRRD